MGYGFKIEVRERLERIERILNKMSTQANALDTAIAALTVQVSNETTVDQSAITLINGIPGLIATAVATALAAGATPTELASLATLQTTIQTNAGNLAAAVTANTPASTGGTAPVTSASPALAKKS